MLIFNRTSWTSEVKWECYVFYWMLIKWSWERLQNTWHTNRTVKSWHRGRQVHSVVMKVNQIVKWFDHRARTRDTYQKGDWLRFKKHCFSLDHRSLWTRNTYASIPFALFARRLRRDKYCVSTKPDVSTACLRICVSTQFRAKLRGGRVFQLSRWFHQWLGFFFSCNL